jgi:hypothetical protein
MSKIDWQWDEENQEMIAWQGPGWYASRQEGDVIRTYFVGDNQDNVPDVYTKGLGTPFWLDK